MSGLKRFLIDEVEMPLVGIVATMEEAGYAIDAPHFHQLRTAVRTNLDAVTKGIQQCAGPLVDKDFNPKSTDQVAHLLFEQLKLPQTGCTPKGKPSTAARDLEAIRDKHEVVPLLLRFRELDKIESTYCGIPDQADDDGRLRVEFNQLDAVTGRFTSHSVLQTLPKKDEFNIRKGFVAAPGHTIVAGDFAQQELNLFAQLSGDQNMIAALKAGVDLHGEAAVRVFRLPCDASQVKKHFKAERDRVKAVQFGLLYGKTPRGLATDLGVSRNEAKKLVEVYFAQFPAVRQYIDKVHEEVMTNGFVDDVFGRRRHFPDARLRRPRRKWDEMTENERSIVRRVNSAKRQAQNFVAQGAAATVTKLAMIRCHRLIDSEFPGARLILMLHDELQFEVPDDLVARFMAALPGAMSDLNLKRFGLDLPIPVEVKCGRSWGELAAWRGTKDG